MSQLVLNNLDDLARLAEEIKTDVLAQKNLLLYGEMGAGKTTFIKALCKALGSKDEVSSPTYAIVNEYLVDNLKIFHFDLFRMKNLEEILDIGFEDYLEQDAICIIEWPQLVEDMIPHGMKIEIEKIDLNRRKFSTFKF